MNPQNTDTTHCTACGKEFRCGVIAGDERCWCFDLPKLAIRTGSTSCYCPECLKTMVGAPAEPTSPGATLRQQ